jgi:trehalose 6-phosphate synthase/phosphatase
MDRPETAWREPALRLLSDFAARTPGALVEEKTVSLAWHYRMARPRVGAARAEELTLRLRAMLAGDPVEILSGAQVIEIRPSALHKGRMVQRVLAHCAAASLLAAIGDDRTDEDLFAALPPGSVAIHVGPLPSTAPLRLRDVAAARALLRSLLKTS